MAGAALSDFFLRRIEINELQPPETQTIHGLLLLLGLWAKLLFPGEDHVLRTLSWRNESLLLYQPVSCASAVLP